MKRDFELIRAILQRIEEGDGQSEVDMEFEGYRFDEVMYNADLVAQHGLINATVLKPLDSQLPIILPIGLTWEGHEFLDSVKNETVWKKIQQTVQEKGGAVSFEVLKALAGVTAKEYFLK